MRQAPWWVWILSIVGVLIAIAYDFFRHVRRAHVPATRESVRMVLFYVTLAVVFGLGMWVVWDGNHAGQFFAGYLTEESLSFDNLFVFLLIMKKFRVPEEAEQKVLLVGVMVALALRAVFILIGGAAISHFSWVFYIFGLFLAYTAVKVFVEKPDPDEEYKENALVRLVGRVVHVAPNFHGDDMRLPADPADPKRHRPWTPMIVVMIAIGTTDVMFALDSIPAIFGLTKVTYIVFMTNAFALLGLRELYFVLGALMKKLPYLSKGLGVILGFIAVKLILEALHTNSLPFLNGGKGLPIPEIPTALSLGVVLGVLAVTAAVSLLWPPKGRPEGQGDREGAPSGR
ncbi:MAG: TerC/Alx family metal homeostasis membrane protein [Bifidobacteriaceae bacterium]|nr:TerC/Alx family metal homeostasis membrane protein [Bifidobacteriaceae bacterium]